jgi:carbonic anhydrase
MNPHTLAMRSPTRAARWILSALVASAWAATGSPARASDDHGAAKPAATAHQRAAPAAPAAAPSAPATAVKAPTSAPAADASTDGLVIVQRRLSEKFGSQRAADATSSAPVVRVTARSDAAAPAPASPAGHAAVRIAAAPRKHAAADAPHWAYDGEGGPAAWGRMKPEFAACSAGKRQSPIDIREGLKLSLDPVAFDYQPSSFKVQDNGHTIQVNLAAGNSIEVLGQRFELVQFHFHRPSEESIDGRRFDMVAHFVHKSLEGRLAVVAVLIERGGAQGQLQQVWNNLPLEKGDTVSARGTLDLERLLPSDRGYFTYMGSLTTPPCSEGVLWMVMKQPLQASADQLGVFARLYPMNARPIQSASGRLIKESN